MGNAKDFKAIYLGGPTVILEISGLRFITDPTFDPAGTIYPMGGDMYIKKTVGPPLDEIGKIDIVLLSHDQHYDNFDNGGRVLVNRVDKTFTTTVGAKRLKGNARGLATWEHHTVLAPNGDRIAITATPARHGPAGMETIFGDVTGFLLSVTGKRNFEIYITGDTMYCKGIEDVAQRYSPDYVFVFAGAAKPRGSFTVSMNSNDAIQTANLFPGAIIIPLQHEGWSHYTQGQSTLRRTFDASGVGSRLRTLSLGATETLLV